MNVKWLLGSGCLLAVALSAPAEELLLRDGGRVVTAGRWSIDGALVVFTLPNGSLASLRLENVDLVASELASIALPRPARAERAGEVRKAAEPARRSVWRLMDRDVPRAVPEAPSSGSTSGDGGPAAAGRSRSPVRVETWLESRAEGGLEIVGHLRNRGRAAERVQRITVHLLDREGEVVGSCLAVPKRDLLEAGEATTFRALFRDIGGRGGFRPSFEIDSVRATAGAD